MDLTPNNTTNNPSTKSPEEHDTETPPRIPPTTTTAAKPLSFSNGILKRHNNLNHNLNHHNRRHHHHPPQVTYKECLKNHAAALGGHALDGCGEFMPSPAATAADPTSIKCAACGCHRNFHRREPDEPLPATHVIEYQPHHRHHPPPPPLPFPVANRSPNSASPPPISSSYYPASAPHMLLALSAAGIHAPPESAAAPAPAMTPGSSTRKRFRTKFTPEQKERMFHFAERVGWKMQKRDEDLVREFCNEIGVDRSVLKVWMHNNKNTFGKRDPSGINNNINDDDVNDNNDNDDGTNPHGVVGGDIHVGNDNGGAYNSGVMNVGANGSSSSS